MTGFSFALILRAQGQPSSRSTAPRGPNGVHVGIEDILAVELVAPMPPRFDLSKICA
jgi:hypothetical protein